MDKARNILAMGHPTKEHPIPTTDRLTMGSVVDRFYRVTTTMDNPTTAQTTTRVIRVGGDHDKDKVNVKDSAKGKVNGKVKVRVNGKVRVNEPDHSKFNRKVYTVPHVTRNTLMCTTVEIFNLRAHRIGFRC